MQRPVLINSWEAAYFDFTGDTIVDLAKEAAALGIDMVVMDDGWAGMLYYSPLCYFTVRFPLGNNSFFRVSRSICGASTRR